MQYITCSPLQLCGLLKNYPVLIETCKITYTLLRSCTDCESKCLACKHFPYILVYKLYELLGMVHALVIQELRFVCVS